MSCRWQSQGTPCWKAWKGGDFMVRLMLHYRICSFLTDRILNSEVVVNFNFYLTVMKAHVFGDISKASLVPLPPPRSSVTAPLQTLGKI